MKSEDLILSEKVLVLGLEDKNLRKVKQMIEDITDRPIWVDLKGKDPHPLGLSEDAGDNDSYKRRCCCSYGVARYYVYIYICFEWVFSCENANVLVETSSGCTSQADSRIVDLSLLPHNGRLGGLSA